MRWISNIFVPKRLKPKAASEPVYSGPVSIERSLIVNDFVVAENEQYLFTPTFDLALINSDLEEKLDRINDKSIWLLEHHDRLKDINTSEDDYTFNVALNETELANFEKEHGEIPSDFRAFLKRFGWNKFPFYGSDQFKTWTISSELSFFHPISEDAPDFKSSLLLAPEWFTSEDIRTLQIADFGCGITYELLLDGPESGYVWCLDVANMATATPIFPLNPEIDRITAIDWLEYWLDLEINAFKKIGFKP